MAREEYTNGARTTLAVTLGPSTATVTPQSYATFPTSGQGRLQIDSELLLVTNWATHPWPVTRGIEGTTAASHLVGAGIIQKLTAGGLDEVVSLYDDGVYQGNGRDVEVIGAGASAALVGGKLQINVPGPTGTGHFIEDEGTPVTQRDTLNFKGVVVTAADNPTESTTDVTVRPPTHLEVSGKTANDHHNQAHPLTGTDHTVTGLTPGHVYTAITPTSAGFTSPTNAAHQASHLEGGSDQFTGGSANLFAKLRIYLAGVLTGGRRGLNFIAGTNVTITATDNPAGDSVDVSIAAATAVAAHAITGAEHTVSGATPGNVVKATSTTTLGLGPVNHSETGPLPDDHHNRSHDHSVAGDSTTLAPAVLNATGSVAYQGDISPAQLTANTNNYNPTGLAGAAILRLTTDASRDLTGLAGGADGRHLELWNVGGFDLVLRDESGSSTAANRFALDGDLTLGPDTTATLRYDATSSRWRLLGVGKTATGGGSGTVTSVALTVPGDLSVAGSPVTGAGTLAVTRANQSANTVLAGPTSGGAATPAYRALVAADIPALAESGVTNLVTDLAAKAPLASPTFTGIATAPIVAVSGSTGAASGVRLVGGTATGAPTTGTFAVRDAVLTTDGHLWICTVAGTPGTWVDAGTAGSVLASHDHTGSTDGGVLTNDQHDGYSEYTQIADPSAPGAGSNKIRLYAKDKAGTATLYYRDEAGTIWELPTVGGSAGGYDAIQEEGASITHRTTLNFVGPGVLVDDSGGATRVRVLDPDTMSYVKDEFYCVSTSSTLAGELGWVIAGGSASYLPSEANHPGLYQRSTGSTSGTLTTTIYGTGAGAGTLLPSATFRMKWKVRLNTNDANTTMRIGASGSFTTQQPTEGIYVEKLDADTDWFFVCRSGGVQTRTTSGVAVSTGHVSFVLRRKDASTISFSINNGAETDIATNVPTTAAVPGTQIRNSAAAAKTLDHDFFDLLLTELTR